MIDDEYENDQRRREAMRNYRNDIETESWFQRSRTPGDDFIDEARDRGFTPEEAVGEFSRRERHRAEQKRAEHEEGGRY